MSVIPDDDNLARSRSYCADLTRRTARNFYYALKLLPEPKRSSMYALYAWMRLVDDIADEEDGRSHEQRVADLEAWRQKTHAALNVGSALRTIDLNGPQCGPYMLWPALADAVHRHQIPPAIFDDAIVGQQQDLQPIAFESFEQLRQYCCRVAGTVGVASIHIWGFTGGQETIDMAIDQGIAFQLTNILRDLREDAGKGRVYLPSGEMAQQNVSADQLRRGESANGFEPMMRQQIRRAQDYYDRSADLPNRISADCRPALIAMGRIYHGILNKIAAEPQRVLRERVSLSLLHKFFIGWWALRGK
jgi:15-cis-phytoene synthase